MADRRRYGSLAVTIYRLLIDPLLSPLRPRIVRLCRDLGVDSVLDIASGTGAQCRMLGRIGIDATGLDLSEEMVEFAASRGESNVRYIQRSAFGLPFEDASFDACLLVLALHEHTEDERMRMLSEAQRVARRCVIIADYERPRHAGMNLAWQLIRFVETSAGPEHHTGFKHFAQAGSLAGLLTRHQLVPTRERLSHFGTVRIVAIDAHREEIRNPGCFLC